MRREIKRGRLDGFMGLFFISPPPKWFLWLEIRMTLTGAGTIQSDMRPPYAIGGFAAEFAKVEGKTHDEEYQCRLWPAVGGLIHEYQTDSSSKQPAP